jgi:hypothetical protein
LEVWDLKINLKLLLPVIVGLLVLPMFAQSAHGNAIDFACPVVATPCTGTETISGGNASGSGIGVINTLGPVDDQGDGFTLKFDTSTGTVSLTENGVVDSSTLLGTITSFSISTGIDDSVDFHANWGTLPADFQAFLGSATGSDVAITSFLSSNGAVQSVDVNIQPDTAPEPATLLLFGSGLLGLGALVRRKMNVV